ncbi:MAG: hypothetical protein M1839_008396 [Geoglossum umbratile]|nr:MAG: hypothetical protein M1839_008396 [Geoglossum umbratile]
MEQLNIPMASSSEVSSPPPTSSPEDSRFQSSSSPKCAKRRSPYTDNEKLDLFFEHLNKKLNWTFEEFLIALTSKSDYKNTRRQQSVGKATYLNTSVLQHFLNRKHTPHKTLLPRIRRALLDGLDIGNYELREEVLELGKHSPFSQYQSDAELTGFENLDLSALGELMGEYTPTTIKLLKAITAPKRGKSHGCFEHIPRYVLILAVLCYTQ